MRAWKETKRRRNYVKSATRTRLGSIDGDVDVAAVEIGLDRRYDALDLNDTEERS
jgi:hypothetical protein